MTIYIIFREGSNGTYMCAAYRDPERAAAACKCCNHDRPGEYTVRQNFVYMESEKELCESAE